MSELINLQVTISGFQGKPTTLFSSYELVQKILIVAKEAAFRRDRFKDCLVVTNDPSLPHDKIFSMDDLKEAIAAFQKLKKTYSADGKVFRLQLSKGAQTCSPDSCVQIEGFDEKGPKYGVSENISCAQMAVLATCLAAAKIDDCEASCNLTDELTGLLAENDGLIFTV